MSLRVGEALAGAARRLASPVGVAAVLGFVVYNLLYGVAIDSLFGTLGAQGGVTSPAAPLALDIQPAVAAGLLLVAVVFGAGVGVLVARGFVSDARGPPGRRLGRATLATLVVNLVTSLAVALGVVALIAPGLYLATSLMFAVVFVAVEDEGPLTAMRSSWSLATGNRWRLLALLVAIVVVQVAVGVVGAGVAFASSLAGAVVSRLVGALAITFSFAAIVAAYEQLTGAAPDPEPAPESDEVGALSAEELDDVDW